MADSSECGGGKLKLCYITTPNITSHRQPFPSLASSGERGVIKGYCVHGPIYALAVVAHRMGRGYDRAINIPAGTGRGGSWQLSNSVTLRRAYGMEGGAVGRIRRVHLAV